MLDLLPPDDPSAIPLHQFAPAAVSKRMFDIVVGSVLALLALPVIVILALGVAVCLRTWPFFAQRRVGYRGRPFTIIKLRTLPKTAPRYASKFDPDICVLKVPVLCQFLRITHLDELPQLLLVPLGTMSLVGPRPRQGDDVEPVDPEFGRVREMVRPGCTGLWQIGTSSGLLATGDPVFDLFYLSHACLRLDAWVLLRTVPFIVRLAAPVEADEVPRWARGSGLLARRVIMLEPGLPVAPAQQTVENLPATSLSEI